MIVLVLIIMYTDATLEINNLRFTALSFSSASIEWTVPAHSLCGNKFHIRVSISSVCQCNVYALHHKLPRSKSIV